MNEELILEEVNEVAQDDVSIVQDDLGAETSEVDTEIEESTVDVLHVGLMEEIEIEVDEAIGWVSGDPGRHYGLPDRNDPDQHIIESITGLREELDEIESLKTVYSDKHNIANYYKWSNNNQYDTHGYFVSLVPNSTEIEICAGKDIFGVSVSTAGFVGGQDDTVPRDNFYGLIVTSGLVDVRCESDVVEGDYVVSNAYGVATKASSGHGYKVVALHDIGGVPYITINLNISADQVHLMGAELQQLDSRMDDAESNIASAVNVANEAHKQSLEAAISSSVSEEAVKEALESILNSEQKIEEFEQIVGSTSTTAAQARAIAESAVTEAERIRSEAVESANQAIKDTSKLRDDFASMEKQITDVEDKVTIVTNRVAGEYTTVNSWDETGKDMDVVYYAEDTKLYWYYDNEIWKSSEDAYTAGLPMAVSGIQVKVDDHSSSINRLTSWQGDTNIAMARIEQKADANGAYIQSTVFNMDKYSVGPYSQAYGFTLDQARAVLEEGMVYVPTGTETHSEIYTYTETDADGKEVVKNYPDDDGYQFTPGYIYTWSDIDSSEDTKTMMWKESAGKIVFYGTSPSGDAYDFWYTNSDTVSEGYEPYTLYKLEEYKNETGETFTHWVAVATLAGNSNNKAVSQIRQDANSIELRVTNTEGSYAGLRAELGDTKAEVQQLSKWANNGAIIKTEANDSGSVVTITAYSENEDTGEITERASLVLNVVEDANGNPTSALSIDADNINFTATADYSVVSENITLDASQITLDGETTFVTEDSDGSTKIDGAHIATGTVTADQIDVNSLTVHEDFKVSIQNSIDDIEIGGRNLAYSDSISHTATVNTAQDYSWNITKDSAYLGTKISETIFEKGETYTLSFYLQKTGGTLNSIGGHTGGYTLLSQHIDGESVSGYGSGISVLDDTSKHYVVLTFRANKEHSDNNVYIQPNRGEETSVTYNLWNIKVEKGNKATDWTPAPDDMATKAEFNILSGEINAKVSSTGNNGEGFGWSLDNNGFYLKQYTDDVTDGEDVFSVNKTGHASMNSGTIGGWDISEDGISKGTTKLLSNNRPQDSLVNTRQRSPMRISVGESSTSELITVSYTDSLPVEGSFFSIEYDTGYNNVSNATATVTWCEEYGLNLAVRDGSVSVSDGVIHIDIESNNFQPTSAGKNYTVEIQYEAKVPHFRVLEDGSFYANAAEISGHINANSGKIGNLYIVGGTLRTRDIFDDTSNGYELNEKEIRFYDNNASLNFGDNFIMTVDSTSGKIQAKGPLEIIGQKTSIKLNTEDADETVNKTFTVYANYYKKSGGIFGIDPNRFVEIWLVSDDGKGLLYNQDIMLKWYSTLMDDGASTYLIGGTNTTVWYAGNDSASSCSKANIQFTNSNGDAQMIQFYVEVWINNEPRAYAVFYTNELTVGSGDTSLNAGGSFEQYSTPQNIIFEGNLVPLNKPADNIYYNLGRDEDRWHTVFCQTSNVESSDRNLKNNIEPLSSQYSQLFDSLRPVSYKFNDNQSGRTHIGLIAQDVEEGLIQAGLTSQDFAGLCYWDKKDGTKGYGLRYGEFIALCIDEIQKLKKRVEELEKEKNK